MEDRIVEHPHRYMMMPVEGEENVVDLIPMPGTITEEGTLLNKATLLSDETSEICGLTDAEATVNNAIKKYAGYTNTLNEESDDYSTRITALESRHYTGSELSYKTMNITMRRKIPYALGVSAKFVLVDLGGVTINTTATGDITIPITIALTPGQSSNGVVVANGYHDSVYASLNASGTELSIGKGTYSREATARCLIFY